MHHDKNTSTKFVAEFAGEEMPQNLELYDHKHRKHGGEHSSCARSYDAPGMIPTLGLRWCVSNPRIWGAGWQARHNRTPKHEGLAGTRARFNRPLSKAPGKKIQPCCPVQ
jgi:hypothetical protein